MSCGNVIADKWNYYKEQLKKVKKTGKSYEDRFYMDGTEIPQTI
jgi:DNA-directed RNA polymerase subunit N (RpoN/RPB10)